jgi:hypothetical protein
MKQILSKDVKIAMDEEGADDAGMTPQKSQLIREIFKETENDFPDKSTEFLLEVAAERCRNNGIKGTDCSDVAEALSMAI